MGSPAPNTGQVQIGHVRYGCNEVEHALLPRKPPHIYRSPGRVGAPARWTGSEPLGFDAVAEVAEGGVVLRAAGTARGPQLTGTALDQSIGTRALSALQQRLLQATFPLVSKTMDCVESDHAKTSKCKRKTSWQSCCGPMEMDGIWPQRSDELNQL